MSGGASPRAVAAMAAAVDLLQANGFTDSGHTSVSSIRVGSAANPVYGGIGGKLVTAGGRRRLANEKTGWRATIGPRSVSIYRLLMGEVSDMETFATSDLEHMAVKLRDNGPPAQKS